MSITDTKPGTEAEKRDAVRLAEVIISIQSRDYGIAEMKATALLGRLMDEERQSEQPDAFIDAVEWRINNINMVIESDGDTASREGNTVMREGTISGFKHALAIYHDCRKQGVI